MSEEVLHSFATSLRRVLYLKTILQNEIKWATGLIPGHEVSRMLKVSNNNLAAQMDNVKSALVRDGNTDTLKFFQTDLSKDQIHSIANIIHLLADLENVDHIESMVARIRAAAENGQTQENGIFIFETVEAMKTFTVAFCNHWALESKARLGAADTFDIWINEIYLLRQQEKAKQREESNVSE